MLLAILLGLSSLFASCSSGDKASSEKNDANVETQAAATNTSSTEASDSKINGDAIIKVNSNSPSIKVKLPEPKRVTVKSGNGSNVVKPKAATAQIKKPVVTTSKAAVQPKMAIASHADFNALLQKHVKNGMVNYAGFKADAAKFDAYLDYLSNNAPSTSDKSKAALAFWMNAYNAYTIKLIVDNLPVASIMDLDGGKVWDRKWIKIGGKTMSLNGIEHDIIRPVFNEPRIHFAVVCAAKSCPPLDNKAFMADTVDAHLERLTTSFINNPKFNTITADKITITPIMDWYAKDFGDVRGYVQKYATTNVGDKAKIKFTDYDWSLNGQ